MMMEQNFTNIHLQNWWRGDMIGKGDSWSLYLAARKKKNKARSKPFPDMISVKSANFHESDSLQKERWILSKLRGCPQVIQWLGTEITIGEKGEKVYNLLLEHASGGSLRDLIKNSKGMKLPEEIVKRYTRSVVRGIKRLQNLGFVHLDIKPANILLVPISETEFTAKLCNFDMAKSVVRKEDSNLDDHSRGKAMYLSPEAILEGVHDFPGDIWAIGCIVLELLTGKRVWDKKLDWDNEKLIHMISHEFGIPEIPSELSEDAKEFLNGCFVRKPEDRFTVDELLELPFVAS